MRLCTAGLALSLLMPSSAEAHTRMTSPSPRNNNDGLKVGPCGNVAPTGTATQLSGAETITINWLETVEHPGYYRIAFSQTGDQGFDDSVLLDDIPDVACGAPPCSYTAEVTVPSEPCVGCSLQLIQYMGNAPPYSLYYSCADIEILAGPGSDGGPANGPDSGSADEGGDPPESVSGGCSVGTGSSGATTHIALLLLAIAVSVRRFHSH